MLFESGTIGAILAGGGALTKTTAGTVTLVGENTYYGWDNGKWRHTRN